MDKQEYKILSEEIMTLVANEQFVEAAEIADRIDWRKVRSFSTLQKISELYRINRRFDEAMDIMLLAYDKNPNSRTIVYSLCELSIDLDDLVSALQYLAMYKKMAPNDKGALILQYKILEMENAKTEDKIEILEELNRKDYTEEWAYQLAYLYHRIGLATKCVETCDQLITWFGYGPFVIKAIELKMLHAPLTEKQKEIYDKRNDISDEIEAYESDEYTVERAESSVAAEMGTEDFHVKTIDMGKFNTMNLQKALAESMRELMGEEEVPEEESPLVSTGELEQRLGNSGRYQHDEELSYEDLNYEEEPQDVSYNYEEEMNQESTYEEAYEEPLYEETYEPIDESEVFFEDKTSDIVIDTPPAGTVMPEQRMAAATVMKENREAGMEDQGSPAEEITAEEPVPSAEPIVEIKEHEKVERKQTSSVFDNVLSQGMDGQISLVVPTDTDTIIEKQITGQMNLQQVLQEWENVKKRKEEERKEKTSQSILEETGKIFADFEAGARTGPLAKIEEEHKMFASRFHDDEIELRSIDAVENASGGSTIWDEVDAAIEADKKAAEAPNLAGAAVVGTAVAAGVAAAGEMAGAGAAIAEGAAAVAGEVIAEGAAAVAGETIKEGVAVATMAADAVIEGGEAVAEGIADAAEAEELSAYGQAASDVLNDESTDESEQPEAVAEPEAEVMADELGEMEALDNTEAPDDTEAPIEKEDEDLPEDMGEEEGLSDQDQTLPVNEQLLDTSQIDDIGSALEAEADKVGANTAEEDNDNYAGEEDHYLTPEEQNLFSDFMYSKKMRNQILDAIDLISLAPYVGNVIITGDSGTGVIELAKAMIKEIQMIDNNFSASRVAKISGDKMNRKDLAAMFNQLTNGALIVEHAGAMTKDTLENMSRLLEGFQEGIIIILTDTKKDIEKLIARYDLITGYFNARIDIKPMNDSALVDYAKKYALTREYKIDEERAVLALHRRINELQIGEHNVTTREIEDIVDEAIERSKRLRLSTYVDILVGKRYDYEDMIILREKDFD